MPKIETKHPTFADVIGTIETMADLAPTRRRDLISALRTMARFVGRDVNNVPANTEWLRQRFRQLHPRQLRVSEKRFQNVKSAVMSALRMTVANNKRHAAFPEMTEEFQGLYEAIPDPMLGYKLSRLFRYCSALGLRSTDVTDQVIKAFEASLVSESLHKNPSKVARDAVLTWNKMVGIVPGWPEHTLARRPKREPWTFPLDAFPQSFQNDVEKWFARCAMDDLFDYDAPVRVMRDSTINHRRFQVRMFASALVRSGRPMETIRSLADLVAVGAFKQGLRYMMEEKDWANSEALFGVSSGLKAVARYHVKVEPEHYEQLKAICSKLDRTADRSRRTKKERLDQFDAPMNLRRLLLLPRRLAELSLTEGPKPRSAPLLLQTACALEILLFCPMRIGNLASLNFERHLRWVSEGRRRTLYIHIPAEEVKNNQPLNYELTGEAADLVRDYIDRARPRLIDDPGSTALFPKMNGGSKNPADLSEQIKRMVFKESGLVINAHLSRSLVARIHSQIRAGDIGTITHVLGDKIGTVMKNYANFEQQSSLRTYQASVLRLRDDEDPGDDRAA